MVTVKGGTALAAGLAMAGLSIEDLWMRYFALGGSYPRRVLEVYVKGESTSSAHEHDVAAQALNECLADQGMDHPVAYADDL